MLLSDMVLTNCPADMPDIFYHEDAKFATRAQIAIFFGRFAFDTGICYLMKASASGKQTRPAEVHGKSHHK